VHTAPAGYGTSIIGRAGIVIGTRKASAVGGVLFGARDLFSHRELHEHANGRLRARAVGAAKSFASSGNTGRQPASPFRRRSTWSRLLGRTVLRPCFVLVFIGVRTPLPRFFKAQAAVRCFVMDLDGGDHGPRILYLQVDAPSRAQNKQDIILPLLRAGCVDGIYVFFFLSEHFAFDRDWRRRFGG
jgi:hypothetical protein